MQSEVFNRYRTQRKKMLSEAVFTSKGNIYVHLDPTDNNVVERASKRFVDRERQVASIESQMGKIRASIEKNFKIPKPEINKTKDVFDFLDKIKGDTQEAITETDMYRDIATAGKRGRFKANIFDKDSQTMMIKEIETSFMNLMQFNKSSQKLSASNADLFRKTDGVMTNLQELLKFFDSVVSEANLTYNDAEIDNMINVYMTTNSKNMEMASGRKFSEAFEDMLTKNDGKLISMGGNDFRKAEKLFETYAIRLRTYQRLLEKLGASIQDTGIKDRAWKERLFKGVSASSAAGINSMGGFLQEVVVSDIVDCAKNGLMESITTAIAGSDQVSLDSDLLKMAMGTEKRKAKTTMSKEDIGLMYNVSPEGGELTLLMKMPGASVKLFNPTGGDYQGIHVRSGASVREIFALSMANATEDKYLIANILSYPGTKGMPAGIKGSAYNYLALQHTAHALAGTLQKQDTAYFMILNRKVFTVLDIMQKMIDNKAWINAIQQKGFTEAQNKNVEAKAKKGQSVYEVADERSEAVLSAFLSAKMNIELKMLAKDLV